LQKKDERRRETWGTVLRARGGVFSKWKAGYVRGGRKGAELLGTPTSGKTVRLDKEKKRKHITTRKTTSTPERRESLGGENIPGTEIFIKWGDPWDWHGEKKKGVPNKAGASRGFKGKRSETTSTLGKGFEATHSFTGKKKRFVKKSAT